jgi:hypothetical protein
MKLAAAIAAIVASVSAAALASRRFEGECFRRDAEEAEDESNRGDLIGTLKRISNQVVNLRLARLCSLRKRDGAISTR